MPAAPRRFLARALLAAVLGLTAAFAAACGSSGSDKGLLSAADSRTIVSALNDVSSGVHQHSCARTRTALQALDAALRNLSPATSTKLVHDLAQGATAVKQLAETECAHPRKTTTSSSTTNTGTTSTTSTTQSTTQSTTTQGTSTTQSTSTANPATQTNPTTTSAGPGNGNGNGNGGNGNGGNGNGNGNGNGHGGGGGAGLTNGGSG